ncbi:MAG TPA: hypothetical protein ENO23_02180 [Alphaproteobacteria bacterium]|nr:hypothetical protein [Alphaproteobacteria bacterium]
MHELTRSAFAALLLVFLLPVAIVAQEAAPPEVEAQEQCTAEIEPIRAVGQAHATATFEQPFGEVVAIEGPEKSGLKVVKVAAPDRAEMAAEGGEAAADARADLAANVSTFLVDASRTAPGTYDVVLKNETDERCSAELTIEGSTEDGPEA